MIAAKVHCAFEKQRHLILVPPKSPPPRSSPPVPNPLLLTLQISILFLYLPPPPPASLHLTRPSAAPPSGPAPPRPAARLRPDLQLGTVPTSIPAPPGSAGRRRLGSDRAASDRIWSKQAF